MQTIKFTEEEVTLLTSMYEDELVQAEDYIDKIKDVLRKLRAPSKPEREEALQQEPGVGKKRGPKPKVKTIEPKVLKKRGRPKKLVAPTDDFATVMVTNYQ